MELHPILESNDCPQPGLWYVISSPDAPSPRVGQSCVFHHSEKCYQCIIVGGADPSTTYGEAYRYAI